MVQSMSIVRHFARVYDLYGSNENEKVRIDMLLDGCEDLKKSYFAVVYNDKAMEAVKVFQETTLPTWCDYFETLKSKNEGNWFVGNKISVADVYYYLFLYFVSRFAYSMYYTWDIDYVQKYLINSQSYQHLWIILQLWIGTKHISLLIEDQRV